MDSHRSSDALDGEFAERVEREIAADERGGRRRQVTGVRLGKTLHALRASDRVALRRVIHAQVVADPADDHSQS